MIIDSNSWKIISRLPFLSRQTALQHHGSTPNGSYGTPQILAGKRSGVVKIVDLSRRISETVQGRVQLKLLLTPNMNMYTYAISIRTEIDYHE